MKSALKATITVLAVLGFGAVRLPLERGLDLERRAAALRDDADTSLSLGEQSTQASLVAVLGGLRSLVAAIWDLRACDAWEKTNYAQVEKEYRFCQRLQPRLFYYWDRGQWMMATNARHYYRYTDKERGDLAVLLEQSFVEKGLRMIKEGQRYLPDDYRIFQAEAELYQYRIRPRQPMIEVIAWRRAIACPGAPSYSRRFAAYALAHVPGREAEALRELSALAIPFLENPRLRRPGTLFTMLDIYSLAAQADDWMKSVECHRILREIYDYSSVVHTPLLISTIQELEWRLDLPPWQCIPQSVGLPDVNDER